MKSHYFSLNWQSRKHCVPAERKRMQIEWDDYAWWTIFRRFLLQLVLQHRAQMTRGLREGGRQFHFNNGFAQRPLFLILLLSPPHPPRLNLEGSECMAQKQMCS